MFQQRKLPTEHQLAGESYGPWKPWPPEGPDITTGDRYVTVDERVGDQIGVVAAPWPIRDALGRLQFGDDDGIVSAWYPASVLQKRVDQLRSAPETDERPSSNVEQDPRALQNTRALRIGDTFWVQGFDAGSAGGWSALRDVTAEAREMAKAAAALAALGEALPPADDRDLQPDDSDEPGTSGPAVGGDATARPTI